MSDWQDAPVVEEEAPAAATSSPAAWASAPVVEDEAPPAATPTDTGDQASRTLQREQRVAAENAPDQVQRGVANKRVPQTFMEGVKQAWEGETFESIAKQNFFVRMLRIQDDQEKLRQKLMQSPEYSKKREELGDAPGAGMQLERWTRERAKEMYIAERKGKAEPDVDWGEILPGMMKAATDNPGKFTGDILKGFAVDPQMMFIPGLGQVAKATGVVGKVGAEAAALAKASAMGAAQMVPIEAAKAFEETGEVRPKPMMQAAAQGAGMVAGIHVAMRPFAAAAQTWLEIGAKKRGGTITEEVKADFERKVQENVDKGMSPTDAVVEELNKINGWTPKQKAEVKAEFEKTIKEAPDATEAGVKPEGSVEQHPGVEGERPATEADGGDSTVKRPQEGEAPEAVKPEEPKVPPDEPPPPPPAAGSTPVMDEAKALLDAVDKGGIPLDPRKLRTVAESFGLDVSKSAKPEETVGRIRDAYDRALKGEAEPSNIPGPITNDLPPLEFTKPEAPAGVPRAQVPPLTGAERQSVANGINNWRGKKAKPMGPQDFAEVPVPEHLRPFFDAVYKITGTHVTPIQFKNAAINKRLNGFAVRPGIDKRVFITKWDDPKYPIHFLTGHEIFHAIETNHPDLAGKLIDVLRSEKPDYAGARARHGTNPSAERARKLEGRGWSVLEGEVGADYLGRRFQDPAFWKALEAKDPSLFKQVSTAVVDFLRKLIAELTGKESTVPTKWVNETKRLHDAAVDMIHQVAKRTDVEFAKKIADEEAAWKRAAKQAEMEQQAKAAAKEKLDAEGLPDNDYFHFTREPGTRDLSAAKAGEGNVRGKGIYLSKKPQTSHTKPRVDRQGNLTGERVEGELLRTTIPKEVADRMFDESRMFTRDEAKTILEKSGFLPDEAADILGNKQKLSGESVYKMLKKQMGDADHTSEQLKAQGYSGVKFKDKAGNDLAVVFENLKGEPVHAKTPRQVFSEMPHEKSINDAKAAVEGKVDRAPPERSLKIGLGNKGQRTIEFPSELGKELFRFASLQKKLLAAPDSERAHIYKTMKELEQRLEKVTGLSGKELRDAAHSYRDMTVDMARTMPEGSVIQIPEVKIGKGKFTGGEGGWADPKVLASIGLAGLSGLGIYALSGGDVYKSIGAAAAAGALPFALRMAGRVTLGTARVLNQLMTDTRTPTKEIFRKHPAAIGIGNHVVDVWQRATNALLKGEPDIKASHRRIRDYVQGYRDVELSPREMAAATEVRKFLDYMGQQGVEGKVLRNVIEDYLPGLYQKSPLSKWADIYDLLLQEGAFRGNMTGMSPKSRHNLHKVIPDYRTVERLIAEGKLKLVPLTDNPIEMTAIYSKSLNKSIANRKLIDTLKRTPGPASHPDGEPIPLVVPITTDGAGLRIAQAMAIMRDKFDLPPDAVEFARKFATLSAPRDYVHIQHPAFEGLRVHRDVVQSLELMFDTGNPHSKAALLGKGAFATSMAAKSMLFSFSLFHAGSLGVVAFTMGATPGQAIGLGGALLAARTPAGRAAFRAARTPSMWHNIPAAGKAALAKHFSPEMKRAIEAGVTLGHHVQDVDPTFMQRGFNLVQKYASDLPLVGPVAGGIIAIPKFVHQQMNHFMWNMVHPTLKLAQFMAEEAHFNKKNPTATPEARAKAMREIASATNDLYGGLNWFELANNVDSNMARNLGVALFGPQGRRFQQILLLAPDWNIAATRVWYEGIKSSVPGISRRASDSMYRSYLFTSALMYLGLAQVLQQKFTGENIWQKEDWSYVDLGDGRKINLNKHFMEGVHLISDPMKFMLNKLNYLPKETIQQVFNKQYLTTDAHGSVVGPPMEGSRIGHAVKGFVSPITLSTYNDPQAFASGMLGFPIHGQSYDAREKAAPERTRQSAPRRAAQAATRARMAGKDEDAARERILDRVDDDIEKAKERVQKLRESDEEKRAANRARARSSK